MYAVTFEFNRHSTEDQIRQFAQEHGCMADLIDEEINMFLFTSESYDCIEELAIQVIDKDPSHLIFSVKN